jgi:hemerythrin
LRAHATLSHYAIAKKGTNEAHCSLAKWTLKYLLVDDFSEPCVSESQLHERLEKYKFYPYCSLYWLYHARKVELEDEDLFELVDSFVFGSPNHLRSYEQMMKEIYYESHTEHSVDKHRTIIYQHDRKDDDQRLSDALFYHIIKEDLRWITKSILRKRPEWLDRDVRELGPPLRIVAVAGNQDMAKYLLSLGADSNKDCPSYELFEVSPFLGEGTKPYDILLKYDPVPGDWPLSSRVTPPFVCVIHVISQYAPELLPLALQHKADINVRGKDGSTPIHCAVLGNSLEAVKALVAAGADIHAETYSRRTCFHIALSLQSWDILGYLLDHNVAVPPDITEEVLSDSMLSIPANVRRKIKLPEGLQRADVHSGWVRTVASRREDIDVAQSYKDPYVSITINGKSLKKIVFKIVACDLSMSSFACLSRIHFTHPAKL